MRKRSGLDTTLKENKNHFLLHSKDFVLLNGDWISCCSSFLIFFNLNFRLLMFVCASFIRYFHC